VDANKAISLNADAAVTAASPHDSLGFCEVKPIASEIRA
jgi:hypothetical protein